MILRLLYLFAVLFTMSSSGSTAFSQMIIAHRGASHDAPENTLAAFRLAIEQGADGFEADFYLAAGGHVLTLHDPDTERVAGRKLLVTEAPIDELRSLDVGSWKGPKWKSERIPTMQEVLAAVPEGKQIFIELKSHAEIVGPMAKIIAASKLAPEQIAIISFHEDTIAECKRQLPHLKAYWLCGFKKKKGGKAPPTVDEVIATLKRIGADALDAEAVPEYFDESFINRLGEAGFGEFHVWTVDDPQIARFYQRLGVASITTNRPGWLRQQLSAGQR